MELIQFNKQCRDVAFNERYRDWDANGYFYDTMFHVSYIETRERYNPYKHLHIAQMYVQRSREYGYKRRRCAIIAMHDYWTCINNGISHRFDSSG